MSDIDFSKFQVPDSYKIQPGDNSDTKLEKEKLQQQWTQMVTTAEISVINSYVHQGNLTIGWNQ